MTTATIQMALCVGIGMMLGIVVSCLLSAIKSQKTQTIRSLWDKISQDPAFTSQEKETFLAMSDMAKLGNLRNVTNSITDTYGGANSPIFV